MEFNKESIGGRIMETITSGLYDGNLNCIREYVQNGIDAEANYINIFFENENTNLVFEDDGAGMDETELTECLGIGISKKERPKTGWRGIGIWSGVPACKRIVIITRKKDQKKLMIAIDCNKIRELMEKGLIVLDILTQSTSDIKELEIGKEEKDNFTVVRLEMMLPNQKSIFKKGDIRNYLCMNIPAPFDETKFKYAKIINNILSEQGINYPHTKIYFSDEQVFRPPYKDDIFWDVQKPITKIFKKNGKNIAIIWCLSHINNKVLSLPNRGIFFKKNGYTIGGENLVRKQTDDTYSAWQYGEIHIIGDNIKENAARNNFEYNPHSYIEELLSQVGGYLSKLQAVNRYQSTNNLKKEINNLNKLNDTNNISKATKKIESIQKKIDSSHSFPDEDSFKEMKSLIDSTNEDQISQFHKLKSSIQSKDPKLLKRNQMDAFNTMVLNFPPELRKQVIPMLKSGDFKIEDSVLKSLKKLLKEKISSRENDMFKLSMEAFGWKCLDKTKKGHNVQENTNSNWIVTEKTKLTITNNNNKRRDRFLGITLYALENIFVNASKHEEGKDSFFWFDSMSKEEQNNIIMELLSTVSLFYKIVEKAESVQGGSSL